MKISPGINHLSIDDNSSFIFNQAPSQLAKKMIKRMKRRLIDKLIRKEEEATRVLSSGSLLALTNLI
jgi:hypothetical protein